MVYSKTAYPKISLLTPRFRFDGFIPALKDNQHMQSLVYIPKDNVILAAYKIYVGDQGTCSIRKFNVNTKQVITDYDGLMLYHASDMTYNPNTKELFISTSTDSRGRNYISVYDYTSMEFKREFQYDYKSVVYGIAYAADTNQFIFYDDSNIRICDVNMESLSFFNVPHNGMNYQNIEAFGNYVYIYYDIAIKIYDLQGNYLTMYNLSTIDEGEGMCYIGNNKFFLGRDIVNKTMEITRDTSRIYVFDTTLACQYDENPYRRPDNQVAYDKILISDTIIMESGVYSLASNLGGVNNYYSNTRNDKRSIVYNTVQNELVFDCSWRSFLKIDDKALVEGGVSVSQDLSLANYLGNYLIQFDFYRLLGLEFRFFRLGAKINLNYITSGKLHFKWYIYVKSLNV